MIERLRDRELVRFGMFFQDRRLYFFAQSFDCFCARDLAFGVKRLLDPIARHPVGDFEQVLIHMEQRHLAFRFAYLRGEFLLNANHFAGMSVRELERSHKLDFRQFLGRAFDHDHVVFRPDVNKIEIAVSALRVRWIRDELAIHATDTHRANRSGKRNVGNTQRGRRAIDRENVGIIFSIRAEEQADDLGVVEISLRKERPKWPIGHSRGERFLFRRPAFALEIAARKFSGRRRFFPIIDREREKILTFFDGGGRDRADQHHGVAA